MNTACTTMSSLLGPESHGESAVMSKAKVNLLWIYLHLGHQFSENKISEARCIRRSCSLFWQPPRAYVRPGLSLHTPFLFLYYPVPLPDIVPPMLGHRSLPEGLTCRAVLSRSKLLSPRIFMSHHVNISLLFTLRIVQLDHETTGYKI